MLEELIENLKSGNQKEVKKAKKEIKEIFEFEREKASKEMISDLEDYYIIDEEKNKIAFIYGLRLAAKNRGREFFPLFTAFITKNIQSDSGNVRQAIIRLTDSLIESLLIAEDLSKEEKQVFSEFIDEVLMLLEKYYGPEYEKYSDTSDMPPSVYKSLELLLSKIMNPGQKAVSYDKKTGMPKWMDCTWKRVPCREDDCPICSRLEELEGADLFERGEFLIDVTEEKSETKEDLPSPEEFPFYNELRTWLEDVISVAGKSKTTDDFWVFTEEAADLFWYMNVLSAKTYRQLCNRYLIENSEKENKVDYKYTNYVLKESVKRIKKSLKEIVKHNPNQKEELDDSFDHISKLEERIFNI